MCIDMNEIKLSTVKITQKGVSELDENRETIFIPKETIKSIILLYGCGVQRPIVLIVFALPLIIIPLYFFLPPLWDLFSSLASSNEHGGGRTLQFLALPLALVPLGLWLFYIVFKKTFYLMIKTETKNKKIVFRNKVSQTELYQFIEQANNDYGYSITDELKNHT